MPRIQASIGTDGLSLEYRVQGGFASVHEIVGKAWPYILGWVAIGAIIHGYVPQEFMASFMGKKAWWLVLLSIIISVPMYSNAAGIPHHAGLAC
jgi:uncharacterized membrane protein YraQ (UPF0718 family)